MNHYSDFGSSVDRSTWIGYQDNIFRPDVSSFTLAEHGAHEVFEQRPVPIYTHQLFGEMPTQGVWNAHFICSTPIAAEAFPFAGGNGDGSGAPQIFDPRSTSATHQYDPHSNDNSPPTTPSAAAQVQAEATISKDMPRAVLDLKRRLDEQQARDRTSFDKLRGELAKLTSMATQLAISLSKHSTSPHTSPPAASAAAPASAVSQVFVEMPTPTSWQGTDGTAPNDCSGHPDPIQSTCVSNRSEQNLDYFLEQAAPETIFDVDDDKLDGRSNEFVPIFTATPEQQINGVEQQEDDQPLKCFCKPPETKDTSACLNITSDVCDLSFELQQKDEERAYSFSVIKSSNSSITRSSQLNIAHSMRELRLLWDPGTGVSTYPSWHPQLLVQQEGTVEHAPLLVHSRPAEIQACVIQRAPAVTNCQVLDSALDMKFQQVPSVHAPSSIYLWLQSLTARIATEKPLSRVPIPEPTQGQSQVTSVSFVWDPGTMLLFHKSKWWLWHTEDMTNWHTNIKFNGVALWLFHFLPP